VKATSSDMPDRDTLGEVDDLICPMKHGPLDTFPLLLRFTLVGSVGAKVRYVVSRIETIAGLDSGDVSVVDNTIIESSHRTKLVGPMFIDDASIIVEPTTGLYLS